MTYDFIILVFFCRSNLVKRVCCKMTAAQLNRKNNAETSRFTLTQIIARHSGEREWLFKL